MWEIAATGTDVLGEGSPLFVMDDGREVPPLAVFDIQAQYENPTVILPFEPMQVIGSVATATATTATVQIPAEMTVIDAIAVGPVLFSPAVNPSTPAAGEFVRQGNTVTLTTQDLPITSGQPAQILGGRGNTQGNSPMPTGVVPSRLLEPLKSSPVVGKFTWTLGLEQEPTGSLELLTQDRDTVLRLRQQFRKGTEIALVGCGFSVGSFTETVDSNRIYQFQIGLVGRRSRPKYKAPSFLRGESARRVIRTNPLDPDPECQIGIENPPSGELSPNPQTARSISLADLAKQVGVSFVPTISTAQQPPQLQRSALLPGSTSLQPLDPMARTPALGSIDPWSLPIPRDTPREATVSWESEAQNLSRINGCYLDYTCPEAVYARDVQSGRTWSYALDGIQIAHQGDCENVSDHVGYAVEYPNVKLEGTFLNPSEPDQPFKNWKRRPPKRVTLASYDEDWQLPPENVTRIKTLSLNWDASGPTKTWRQVTTEDGYTVREVEIIYGFAYTSRQVYSPGLGELSGNPANYWQVCSYKVREILFDPDYGYEIGSNTTGWRLSRFAQESDRMEAFELDPVADSLELQTYTFRRTPINERSRKGLQSLASLYPNTQEEPALSVSRRCNRDGTSEPQPQRDPTYAPAMGVMEELSYSSSFAVMPNPENTPDSNPRLPPLTTGEESMNYLSRHPFLSPDNVSSIGRQERTDSNDRFLERTLEDSAQGAGFREKAVREAFREQEGQIPSAQRKPPPYEAEEPESKFGDPLASTASRTEYYLRTPGYHETDPVQGGLNYPAARTLGQAMAAARTELMLRDIRESIQYSFELPFNLDIRPMDWMNLRVFEDHYRARVISITHTLNIEFGVLTAELSQVQAGIARDIPITQDRRIVPNPNAGGSTFTVLGGRGLRLGNLFEAMPPSRRNF